MGRESSRGQLQRGYATPRRGRGDSLGVIYQGIFVAGLCFAIQAMLLRHHSASQISVFGFATPLFGVGLGVLLRGDPLSANLLVAAICVAVGIVLVNVSRREGPEEVVL